MTDTQLEPAAGKPAGSPSGGSTDTDPGGAQTGGSPSASVASSPLAELAVRARREAESLDTELREIEMLVGQTRAEALRHDTRRGQAADKVASTAGRPGTDPKELADLNAQLMTLTQRATLMAAQVDVLEGKARAITRYRDSASAYASALEELVGLASAAVEEPREVALPAGAAVPATSRAVLAAQEDMRRDIAREMHDGPAQSLTNIILQAQIVERLLDRDPEQARREVGTLNEMVQRSLDATKTFIFDVRPMVLDDLGLVPTLRRLARERSRRSHVPVAFDSQGADRRLSPDVESAIFRSVDEALAAYTATRPDEIALTLDWTDGLEVRVAASRAEEPEDAVDAAGAGATKKPRLRLGRGKSEPETTPAALAAMIEDRKADEAAAKEAARVRLSAEVWATIQERAFSGGLVADLDDDGATLRLSVGDSAR